VRVQRQDSTEKNFKALETRVSSVVEALEKQAKQFIGFMTGEGGYASFKFSCDSPWMISLRLHNFSEYPIFDFHSEIINLDEPIDVKNRKLWTRLRWNHQHLFPSQQVNTPAYIFDFSETKLLRLNIFIGTRSGLLYQQIRFLKIEDTFVHASRTWDGETTYAIDVSPDYPGWDPNAEEQFWND
jgi:hypothetical protein